MRCPDYGAENLDRALRMSFENLGGIDKYIKPGMKVVLKPNLVMKKHPDSAATTHPALVRSVAKIAREIAESKEGGKVVIADSPGGPYSERALREVYSACGMYEAAEEAGAELNFDTSEVEAENPAGKYLKKVTLIKPLTDADIIINLPKLKTHGMMVYTGAVKNMFGAVPGVLKAECHFRLKTHGGFANALIDIYLSVKPSLNIMDAVIGMDGNGPTAGNPRKIGLILAGEDGFELDCAAARLIKAPPLEIPVIKEAVDRGLCPVNPELIELSGENIADAAVEGFQVPRLNDMKTVRFFKFLDKLDEKAFGFVLDAIRPKPVINARACAGCAECAGNCPAGAIKIINGKPKIDMPSCIRCFCCQELCPAKAVEIKRRAISEFLINMSKKI